MDGALPMCRFGIKFNAQGGIYISTNKADEINIDLWIKELI